MLREGTLKKQHVFYKKDRTSSLIWIGIPSRDLKYKSEAQRRRLCCKYGVGRYRCIESNLRQGVDVDGRILQREKKKNNHGQSPEKQQFKFGSRCRRWQEIEKNKERRNSIVCGTINIKERER